MPTKKKNDGLTFKGFSMVRTEDAIYFGDPSKPFIAVLQISETAAFQNLKLPTRVAVQIISTDDSIPLLERIKKNTVQNNLYDALNISAIWLERILRDENTFDNDTE